MNTTKAIVPSEGSLIRGIVEMDDGTTVVEIEGGARVIELTEEVTSDPDLPPSWQAPERRRLVGPWEGDE